MRNPLNVTSSAAIVTTLPVPLPRISAPCSPMSVSGLLITIGPACTPASTRMVSLGAAASIVPAA